MHDLIVHFPLLEYLQKYYCCFYQINLNEKYYNRYTGDPISTTKDIVMRNQDGDMIDRDGNVSF